MITDTPWDFEADLIIVGYGGAGAACALTATTAGGSVILLEKAPKGHEGGNTRVAAQGYLNTSSPEKARDYLNALCGHHPVPQAMVAVGHQQRPAKCLKCNTRASACAHGPHQDRVQALNQLEFVQAE